MSIWRALCRCEVVMSPSADNIINAVRAARTSDDPAEVACSPYLNAATNVISEDDHAAKVFLARLMVKVARQLDPDVSLSTQ